MKTAVKVVISSAYVIILVALGIFFLASQPTLVGFAVYEDSCGGSLSAEGYWELDADISCATGNGITIDSSDVILDCKDFSIIGGHETDSTAIIANSNLTNITIQNCNLANFSKAISVDSDSNLNIQATYADANQTCTSGDWTDLGNNTGCLEPVEAEPDPIAITINLSDVTIFQNESLEYQVEASSTEGNLTLYEISDIENFTINNETGIVNNNTNLAATNFTVTITVFDDAANNASADMTINVLEIVEETTEETTEDTSDSSDSSSDSDDDSSSSSSSSGGDKNKEPNICGEDKAWQCKEWGECIDGFEKRTCQRIEDKCDDALPVVKRECQIEAAAESQEEVCNPDWQCIWSACTDGVETASDCFDVNGCNLDNAPTERTCVQEENVVITGGAVTALEKLKGLKNPVNVVKEYTMAFIVVLMLVIGFILNLVLTRQKRKKSGPFAVKKEKRKINWSKFKFWEKIHFRKKRVEPVTDALKQTAEEHGDDRIE